MADGIFPAVNTLNANGVNGTANAVKKKSEVGKDEFLQLLVTQLKNQDPLEPMKGEEFAVNLAQFSQLEQLIAINQKLTGSDDSAAVASLAGYLGKEITLVDNNIQFSNGDGGIIKFDLAQEASSVRVELLNSDGSVKDVIEIGELNAGRQAVALAGNTSENGTYAYRIMAKGRDGREFQVAGRVAGVVSGFVPGPEPKLLIGSREVDPSAIAEVSLPAVGSAEE